MKIAVLLSAGRHSVSGRPAPVPVELQALRLAVDLAAQCGGQSGGDVTGLHAGPELGPLTDALGHGLAHLIHLRGEGTADPAPALATALAAGGYDLILAGRAGQGGWDAGLLPYTLARALGLPIIADAAGLAPGEAPGTLGVEQALARGARRRLVVRLPALVTVHSAAPAPLPFAFAGMRRGRVETREAPPAPAPAPDVEERAYRPRPKLIAKAATGASALERLRAATEAASGGGRLLVDPAPEEAAREILAHLRALGLPAGR
ncbi:electron transfer flavoprotein subunit beta [Ancylobacter vacuolatus]|uniref:Electron transfer flavoprotein beta subunit n=1 Tax=Ancylobacter vacuolatus TaxID=223389 RepID=A0ABU0DJB9_9HYPH|nr:electron transfer flavoprotein subunit beta [Ancylobacter vacuolatus]MDQ0348526.1 electron transfer flavoprotein beta subunit [Ancylobacter vacuolatus]